MYKGRTIIFWGWEERWEIFKKNIPAQKKTAENKTCKRSHGKEKVKKNIFLKNLAQPEGWRLAIYSYDFLGAPN